MDFSVVMTQKSPVKTGITVQTGGMFKFPITFAIGSLYFEMYPNTGHGSPAALNVSAYLNIPDANSTILALPASKSCSYSAGGGTTCTLANLKKVVSGSIVKMKVYSDGHNATGAFWTAAIECGSIKAKIGTIFLPNWPQYTGWGKLEVTPFSWAGGCLNKLHALTICSLAKMQTAVLMSVFKKISIVYA